VRTRSVWRAAARRSSARPAVTAVDSQVRGLLAHRGLAGAVDPHDQHSGRQAHRAGCYARGRGRPTVHRRSHCLVSGANLFRQSRRSRARSRRVSPAGSGGWGTGSRGRRSRRTG
jgi:hypothetical protein